MTFRQNRRQGAHSLTGVIQMFQCSRQEYQRETYQWEITDTPETVALTNMDNHGTISSIQDYIEYAQANQDACDRASLEESSRNYEVAKRESDRNRQLNERQGRTFSGMSDTKCSLCEKRVTKAGLAYSQEHFGITLCGFCQRIRRAP